MKRKLAEAERAAVDASEASAAELAKVTGASERGSRQLARAQAHVAKLQAELDAAHASAEAMQSAHAAALSVAADATASTEERLRTSEARAKAMAEELGALRAREAAATTRADKLATDGGRESDARREAEESLSRARIDLDQVRAELVRADSEVAASKAALESERDENAAELAEKQSALTQVCRSPPRAASAPS